MAEKPVLLFDVGNIILGVDFQRVFSHWAKSAECDVARFYQAWTTDTAYEAHEVGRIDFSDYCKHLAELFDITLTEDAWRAGWNDLWTTPLHGVINRLPALAERYDLYAFSNTNPTHEAYFRTHYDAELAHFAEVFTSSSLQLRKPDIAAYHAVCKKIGSPPHNTLFIDDNHENIQGAEDAGLQAHWCQSEDQVVTLLDQLD